MVDRYKASTSVPTAPVARPQNNDGGDLAAALGGLARQATEIATAKVNERMASLEAASLNSARLELAKRGSQLAIDLQKDRIAGSDYVPDLEKARSKLKDEIWATVPGLVQKSAKARAAWDDIWTGDEIASSRSATAWQMGQQKEFALRTVNDQLADLSARAKADPDGSPGFLEEWRKAVPGYAGLVDPNTLAEHQKKGEQEIVKSAALGLARQGKFDAAEELIAKTAGGLDPAVAEDARASIRGEQGRQESETRKREVLAANIAEVDILDGKYGRRQLNEDVETGKISRNDKPALIRAIREEDNRRKAEANMSAAEKAALADWSLDAKQMLETMPPELFLKSTDQWPVEAQTLYAGLDRDRRRAVDQSRLDMLKNGQTADASMGVYRDLVVKARTLVPKEWKLSTSDVFGERDGLALSGELYKLAKTYAQANGGKGIPEKDAKELVYRALNGYKPFKVTDKFREDMADIRIKDQMRKLAPDLDPDLALSIQRDLKAKLKRAPTAEEFMKAYNEAPPW